jgi:hypothetical protein
MNHIDFAEQTLINKIEEALFTLIAERHDFRLSELTKSEAHRLAGHIENSSTASFKELEPLSTAIFGAAKIQASNRLNSSIEMMSSASSTLTIEMA